MSPSNPFNHLKDNMKNVSAAIIVAYLQGNVIEYRQPGEASWYTVSKYEEPEDIYRLSGDFEFREGEKKVYYYAEAVSKQDTYNMIATIDADSNIVKVELV